MHMNLFCTPVRRLGSLLILLWLSLAASHVRAQFRVEVTGVGLTQLPVLVAPFKGEAQASQKLSQIVQADLTRSGQFKPLPAASLALDEMSRPDWAVLRPLSAEALVAGSVTRLANGRYDVRARLWDAVKGQEKSDFKDNVTAADLRLSAHRVSDWVYQQLTGTPGVFTSRISYVTKSSGRYNLWIADSDGEGARSALSSPEPIISPSWSPTGAQLAYVSFESRKPVVYVHELASGQRRVVANFKGSNSAPAWSPDGRSIVATLSREGGSQLYRVSLQGGEPQRLTSGNINTEPAF
jgi:TolB protein